MVALLDAPAPPGDAFRWSRSSTSTYVSGYLPSLTSPLCSGRDTRSLLPQVC